MPGTEPGWQLISYVVAVGAAPTIVPAKEAASGKPRKRREVVVCACVRDARSAIVEASANPLRGIIGRFIVVALFSGIALVCVESRT